MAKKKKKKAKGKAGGPNTAAVADLRAALPADIKVIPVPANATVTVDVDVNDMIVPYSIALDTDPLLQSLVDSRRDLPPMAAGTHRLSWGFAHGAKDWMHKLTLIVDGTATVLDNKSEKKKDPDTSIGVAFLVVA